MMQLSQSDRATHGETPMDALTRMQTLLRDLFQLDTADLDFGLYRLFHLKRREIDAFIKQADSRELARAMYLGGVARMQAAKGTDSRLLKEAVLLFMKVAILCPGSSDAPAALFCAGEASELIGDKAGATAAYTDLTVRGGQSEFVKRAAEKLKALQAEGPQDKTEGRPGDKG